jgi:chemotaxis regulatin CheY-phosphate phosphatase CheZ
MITEYNTRVLSKVQDQVDVDCESKINTLTREFQESKKNAKENTNLLRSIDEYLSNAEKQAQELNTTLSDIVNVLGTTKS